MSDSSATATARSGIGFFGLLTIVLVTLKILGYGTYSWFIAFLPLIINIGLGIIILIILFIVLLVSNR